MKPRYPSKNLAKEPGNKVELSGVSTRSPAFGRLGGEKYFPFRIVWIESDLPGDFPVQVLFSVPKKKFKSAVQRNRIKRRMREAYRKNKHLLYQHLSKTEKKLALGFIYTSPAESDYHEIEQKIILSLQYLVRTGNCE